MEMIMENKWSRGSGKRLNPGKHYFLKLTATAVRDVTQQRDGEGFSFARKEMVRTGISLNTSARWEVCQLFPKLQNIVSKYRNHFGGEAVLAHR